MTMKLQNEYETVARNNRNHYGEGALPLLINVLTAAKEVVSEKDYPNHNVANGVLRELLIALNVVTDKEGESLELPELLTRINAAVQSTKTVLAEGYDKE